MIVVMEPGATDEMIEQVIKRLRDFGFDVHLSKGVERTVIGAIGEKTAEKIQQIEATPGVQRIIPILQPYKLASKEFRQERTQVNVAGVVFGGAHVPVIAGPCAVESREQLLETARLVKAAGAHLLRGGAYKPRTSPYSFQGLAEEGLKLLAEAREETGLTAVCLSGETFHSAWLRHAAIDRLTAQGFRVYRHHQLPTGDGGIALGQAMVARRRWQQSCV